MKKIVRMFFIGSVMVFVNGCGSIADGIEDAMHSILKFNDTHYSIPDNDSVVGATSEIDITTSGIAALANVRVSVEVIHPRSGDLKIVLESPHHTQVLLSENRGGDGENIDILFDDDADRTIDSGDVPLGDKYVPEELLSHFDGENPVGVWKLHVYDTQAGNTGTLTHWALFFD